MFTGIITETGTVERASRSRISIRTSAPLARRLSRGASIAVDGACLTVAVKRGTTFTADVMPETIRRTTFANVHKGSVVNLELPATPSTLLAGHIVQGHVDGRANVRKIERRGAHRLLTLALPRRLARFVVEKGSIAVNGVSLTVIAARGNACTIGIIPHTWRTAFRTLAEGDEVNVEVDVLAKYAARFAGKKRV